MNVKGLLGAMLVSVVTLAIVSRVPAIRSIVMGA